MGSTRRTLVVLAVLLGVAALLLQTRVARPADARWAQAPGTSLYLPLVSRTPAVEYAPVGQIGGDANAVAYRAPYVYLGVAARVLVVDPSDADHPRVVGTTDVLPEIVRDIEVVGDTLYVAAQTNLSDSYVLPGALLALDLADPLAPRLAHTVDMPKGIGAIAYADGRAYVAAGFSGLIVYDVVDPLQPREIGRFHTTGFARDVAVGRQYAAVAQAQNGALIPEQVYVLYIGDPTLPTEVGVLPASDYSYFTAFTFIDDLLYVADPDRPIDLTVIDPDDWGALDPIARIDRAAGTTMARFGSLLYVIGMPEDGYIGNLGIWDVTDPAAPRRIDVRRQAGSEVTWVGTRAIAAAPGLVFAVGGSSTPTLQVINTSDPRRPEGAGTLDLLGNTRDVRVAGDIAYVWDEYRGVRLVDVSAPDRPRSVGLIPDVTTIAMAATRDHAFFAGTDLQVHDVRDPHAPRLVARVDWPPSHHASGIALAGDHAYVAIVVADAEPLTSRLAVLDVSDPTSPVTLATADAFDILPWVSSGGGVVAGEGHAFVATNFGTVTAIDVRDPGAPRVVGQIELETDVQALSYQDGHVYAASSGLFRGLIVIGVRDPSKPRVVARLKPRDWPRVSGLAVGRGMVHAMSRSAISAIDVSVPVQPREVGQYRVKRQAYAIALTGAGDHLLVAEHGTGLTVLRVRGGAR